MTFDLDDLSSLFFERVLYSLNVVLQVSTLASLTRFSGQQHFRLKNQSGFVILKLTEGIRNYLVEWDVYVLQSEHYSNVGDEFKSNKKSCNLGTLP